MTTTTTATFDADSYKRSTHDQWQDAAAAWHRWGPFIEDWLASATEAMLDMAASTPVRGCSTWLPVRAAKPSRRHGASGRADTSSATDISANILEFAAAEAASHGLHNVSTLVVDGEDTRQCQPARSTPRSRGSD